MPTNSAQVILKLAAHGAILGPVSAIVHTGCEFVHHDLLIHNKAFDGKYPDIVPGVQQGTQDTL